MSDVVYYNWNPDLMLEVSLPTPDNFLQIKETLTRIGIASKKDKRLYQSVHILHKQGKYFLVHFLEMFFLDGKDSTLTVNDVDRRNAIALLLEDWGLLKIINKPSVDLNAVLAQIKILSFKEKDEWTLVSKYQLGNKQK